MILRAYRAGAGDVQQCNSRKCRETLVGKNHPLAGEEPRPSLNSSVGTRELRHFLSEAWHVNAYDRPSAQECVQRLSVMEPPSLNLS